MMKRKILTLVSLFVIIPIVSCDSSGDSSNTSGMDANSKINIVSAFPQLTFERPLGIENAGDGTNRLFVVEQRGVIKVITNISSINSADASRDVNLEATSQIFLDIQDRVYYDESEQGMLGLVFHPDYENNGFLFVNYMAENPLRNVISRFTVSEEDPNQADPDSELILLEIEQPHLFHNGGQLVFGPDGYLYISLGDGGPVDGPSEQSQNLTNLFGSILRIDLDKMEGTLNYGIPPDNPFFGNTSGFREEIYAYGLRNPWRMSFDTVTGSLWTGDVGEASREEIDIVEKGKNYGWPIMEGTLCFEPPSGCDMTDLELPIWEYGRNEGGTIIGGFVYRGSNLPDLEGKYIYGDFISGRIWALTFDGTTVTENRELLRLTDSHTDSHSFIITFDGTTITENRQLLRHTDSDSFILTSFGVDEQNELYITAFDGNIYTLIDENVVSE